MPTKVEQTIENIGNVVTKKGTRNLIFLILSIIALLAINSLLPIINGGSRYTEDSKDYTYLEYKNMIQVNKHYTLTWKSIREIEQYKQDYKAEHPETTADEFALLEPPDQMTVHVYTKYFFEHAYWWLSTVIHVVSVLLVYYSVFNYVLYIKKREDTKYNNLCLEVDKAAAEELDPVTFDPWMKEFNMQRKKKQHIANVRFAIDKLERHTSYKVKSEPGFKHDKYILRKKRYEEFLTEDYINTYVPTIKVKYFKYIYPTFVTAGTNNEGKTVDNYSLIRSNQAKIADDGLKKTISSFAITTLFAIVITFTISAYIDSPWYTILFNVLIRIAPLLIQLPMAFDYCDSFMEDQLIANLVSRRSIALLYLADTHKEESHEDINGD